MIVPLYCGYFTGSVAAAFHTISIHSAERHNEHYVTARHEGYAGNNG